MSQKIWIIFLCLMAAGAIWLTRERKRSAQVSCFSLLRGIDGAKQAWALDHNRDSNDVPTWDDLLKGRYLRERPKCPQGGTYSLGKVGDRPRCSYSGHNLDIGLIEVSDSFGKPIVGASITVVSNTSELIIGETDAFGRSRVKADFSGSEIVVSITGYVSKTFQLLTNWPVRLSLTKQSTE